MLVLTRRPGQRLIIGDNVTVTVLEIRGNRIRIGISAPNQMPVHREEIAVQTSNSRRKLNLKPLTVAAPTPFRSPGETSAAPRPPPARR